MIFLNQFPSQWLNKWDDEKGFPDFSESTTYLIWLVVWNINFIFPYIGFLIIPIDVHIFQRGGPGPPTSQTRFNQRGFFWKILQDPSRFQDGHSKRPRGRVVSRSECAEETT